jgi:hypothetical protein
MKKLLLLLMLLPFVALSQTDLVSWSPNPNTNLNPVTLNNSNLSTFAITTGGFTPSLVWTGIQGTGFPSGNSLDLTKYFQYSVAAYSNNTVTIKEIKFNYRGTAKRHMVRYSKSADFSNPVTLATEFNNDAAEWTIKSGNITLTGSNIITLNAGERIYIRIYAYHGDQRVITDSLVINGSTGTPSGYSGTIHVGAAQPSPFNTITNAVSALSSFGITGPVTIVLDDALYSNATGETFPITMNAVTGSSVTNTVTFRPNATMNVKIEGSNINSYTGVPAIFKFNGADNIVIDGSNTTNGTTRNLTINNKDNIDYIERTVIWIASLGSNPATNITVKNSNIRQAVKNANSNFCVGVYSGGNNVGSNNTMTVVAATADNTGINITNNDFMNVKQGVYINGSATTATTNVLVNLNDLGAESNTETIIQPACFSNVNGFEYSENYVYNLYRNTNAGDLTSAGIFITGNTRNGSILKNNMRNLVKTQTDNSTFAGITLASTSTSANILVANNFILNVSGNGNSDAALNGHGINVASGNGYRIYNNTVKLQTNQANAGYSSALFVNTAATGIDLRNNIFVNLQTTGIRRTAIMVKNSKSIINTIFTNLDYNDYYSLDQLGFIANNNSIGQIDWPANPDYIAGLQQWKTVTGKDANSLNVNAAFVSVSDLHMSSANAGLDNLGTPIAEILKDIDGQLRSTTPDMGADEFGTFNFTPGNNTGIYCDASTTWNGSEWSNGIPTAEKDAIFTGNYTHAGGTFNACSIHVSNTAVVLFKDMSNAVVTNSVNVATTASLTFESSSNLIQVENTQNSGNVTIQRFGSRLKKLDYTFWSSPVTGTQTLQQFSPATLPNRFYTYNTSTNNYLSVASPSTTTFVTGKSYLIRMPDQITGPLATAYNAFGYRFAFEGLFTGTPNNGTIHLPLVYTNETNCYNGVGNPYPSPISITDFIDANLDNIEGTLWIWRKTNNPDETSYCAVTKLGFIANRAPGGGGVGGNDGNDLIADPFEIDEEGVLNTGQGFIIKAKNNNDLVFRNNMRKSNNYANFFRNGDTGPESNAVEASRLWINIGSPDGQLFSQTMVGYTPQATLEYDNGIDGRAFVDGTSTIYSVIEGEKLGIQGRPAFNIDDVVALGFKTEVAGDFVMKLDRTNGIFAGEQDIYIKDNLNGTAHDIKNGDFSFTSEAGTFDGRFEIIYKQPEALGVSETQIKETVIFGGNQQVKITSSEEIKSVTVYDINGKVLYQNNNVNNTEFASSNLTASQQVVIVNAVLLSGQAVSKKIMMN